MYLGHVANFTFLGPYDFTKVCRRLGKRHLLTNLGPCCIGSLDYTCSVSASDKGLSASFSDFQI